MKPSLTAAATNDERRGILLLVLAALCFSVMSLLVKLAGEELPVATLVLARGLVTLVLSLGLLLLYRIPPLGNDKPRLLLRGLFGLGGLACFFFAVTELPLAEVTVIHYLNPVFTAAAASFFLGEQVDRRLLGAIVISLFGTAMVVRPGFLFGNASGLSAAGVLAAFCGAVLAAFAYTTVRRLRHTDNPHVIVFYFPLVAVPATLPFAIRSWVWPTPRGWVLLLGLGIFTQAAQVLLTKGLMLVPAGRGTTVGYVQIVFASAFGFLFFNQAPGVWTILGGLLILAAMLSLLLGRSLPAS